MSEIKKDLTKLEDGDFYTSRGESYVITESHTLSDIVRFLVTLSDKEEIQYLLDNLQDK